MRVFFDQNTSPRLASTLHGYISHDGHEAHHISTIQDLPRGRHSTDLEWIEYLRQGKDWIFFTRDRRILKNPAERGALKAAGIGGFVLADGFKALPQNKTASILLLRWPEIENLFNTVEPWIYELPLQPGSRLKPSKY